MAANAEKDPKTGKWLIQYRYTDWQGKRDEERLIAHQKQRFLTDQKLDYQRVRIFF